jgi:hypothetical protein
MSKTGWKVILQEKRRAANQNIETAIDELIRVAANGGDVAAAREVLKKRERESKRAEVNFFVHGGKIGQQRIQRLAHQDFAEELSNDL